MSEKYPFDAKTLEIKEFLKKHGKRISSYGFPTFDHAVPAKGITKLIVFECPAWKEYQDLDPRGSAMSVSRRMRRMWWDGIIFLKKINGVEYWVI